MIPGKNHHLRLLQHRAEASQNFAQLQGQRFKAPQRAQGFGFVVQGRLQGLAQCGRTQVGDGRKRVQESVHSGISMGLDNGAETGNATH